jgi:hypothetical protein
MAWQQRSLRRSASRSRIPEKRRQPLAQIQEHVSHDTLVGWAWRPGGTREPAPGTQEQFGALIAAWIETGAACPR